MAAEFYIRFKDRDWFSMNKGRVEEKIMSSSTFIYHEHGEFHLKGKESIGCWSFDVRLFLQYADYILLEISCHPLSIEQSLKCFLEWLREETLISIEDEDGERSNLVSNLFITGNI